jgi:hypothetical protein
VSVIKGTEGMDEPTHIECRTCGVVKPVEAYRRWTKSEGNGRLYRMRSCAECHRIKARESHKAWRDSNREHIRTYSREQMRRIRRDMTAEQSAEYLARTAKNARSRRKRLKAAIYLAYGGAKCVCCGETEPLFLSIDHVNNDGYELRKKGQSTGEQFQRWIIDNGFPPDYQILCMNCNFGKARNGGVCPHQLEKVQRLGQASVGSSDPKRPALICDEVKI